MNNYLCLDSSVLIKVLVSEEDSNKAVGLIERIVTNRQTIVLPAFAWAEIGTVLRKKVAGKMISSELAEEVWEGFNQLGILTYVEDSSIIKAAWRIAEKEKLPTLYDAAYLAVAEIISRQSNEICEFWTADERLINSVKNKNYIRLLKDFKE